MNAETAWILLPRPPQRVRVYACRCRNGHLGVELRLRPPGEQWEFVGWLANDMLLNEFLGACKQALTPVERSLTKALKEGPDTPYGLSKSRGASESRCYKVVRAMIARRKVRLEPMFKARAAGKYERVKPLEVLQLAEAS